MNLCLSAECLLVFLKTNTYAEGKKGRREGGRSRAQSFPSHRPKRAKRERRERATVPPLFSLERRRRRLRRGVKVNLVSSSSSSPIYPVCASLFLFPPSLLCYRCPLAPPNGGKREREGCQAKMTLFPNLAGLAKEVDWRDGRRYPKLAFTTSRCRCLRREKKKGLFSFLLSFLGATPIFLLLPIE